VKRWRRREPNTPVVLYVNTLAEAKAYADVCCTSANAVKIVNALESDTILFGPDANLAWYVSQKTGKTVIPVPKRGFCQTHILFSKEDIATAREENPNAVVMVHPECLPEVQRVADFIGSTSQMCRYANNSSAKRLVVATEVGLLHRLKKENPGKEFVPAYEGAMCVNMKLNTLTNIYLALKEERNRMVVPKSVAKRAKISLENMFEIISR
jgi:quinolinate synthase